MRILVCGGRDWSDRNATRAAISQYCKAGDLVIYGGARGADTLAAQEATKLGIATVSYPAKWGKFGKAAGPIRNREMLERGKPDLVIAFPGKRGTAHMVRISREAGVNVVEIL